MQNHSIISKEKEILEKQNSLHILYIQTTTRDPIGQIMTKSTRSDIQNYFLLGQRQLCSSVCCHPLWIKKADTFSYSRWGKMALMCDLSWINSKFLQSESFQRMMFKQVLTNIIVKHIIWERFSFSFILTNCSVYILIRKRATYFFLNILYLIIIVVDLRA